MSKIFKKSAVFLCLIVLVATFVSCIAAPPKKKDLVEINVLVNSDSDQSLILSFENDSIIEILRKQTDGLLYLLDESFILQSLEAPQDGDEYVKTVVYTLQDFNRHSIILANIQQNEQNALKLEQFLTHLQVEFNFVNGVNPSISRHAISSVMDQKDADDLIYVIDKGKFISSSNFSLLTDKDEVSIAGTNSVVKEWIIIPKFINKKKVVQISKTIPGFFDNQDLIEIFIGDNIKAIGDNTFEGNLNLKKVVVTSDVPPSIDGDIFLNANAELAIYVRASSLQSYKTEWSIYKEKIQAFQ
ncbi:MAG: hypothetical protein LBU60_04660 [Clostridiales bacterium]|jgi:hypothetical protein|nr:hypothetical protein [Clostridiales bacterium]